jgi:hypothetical protein
MTVFGIANMQASLSVLLLFLLLLTGLGNVICRRMDCKMSHVVLHTEDRATAHP